VVGVEEVEAAEVVGEVEEVGEVVTPWNRVCLKLQRSQ
jgi:hypothetical protein